MTNTTEQATTGRDRMKMPTSFILALSVLVILVIVFSSVVAERITGRYPPLITAALKIELEAATAHLQFEETIIEDRHDEISSIRSHLDRSAWYARAMLSGSEDPDGVVVPLVDPQTRAEVKTVLASVIEFRAIAEEQWAARSEGGTELDPRFCRVFNDLLVHVSQVSASLDRSMQRDIHRFRLLQALLLFLSIAFSALAWMFLNRNRRRHESTLKLVQHSEKKFRTMYDNAPLSYQSLDADGRFLDVNSTWCSVLGYEREEIIGTRFGDLLHPDWRPHFEEQFPAFKARGYVHDVQFRIRHKEGRYLDISFEGCIGYGSDGKFQQTYCVFQDITTRMRVTGELRASEEKFRTFANQSTEGISVADLAGRYTYVNPAFCDMVGWDAKELLEMTVFDVTADKQDKATFDKTKGNQEGVPVLVTLVRKNGSTFIAEVTGKVLSTEGAGSVMGTVRDVTEKIRDVDALREAKEFSENLINTADALIVTLDLEARITSFNDYAETLTGRKRAEVLGRNWFELFIPERDRQEIPAVFSDVLKNMPEVSANRNPILVAPEGERMMQWRNSVLRDAHGEITGVLAIGTDLSDQIELENQLRQAQKMEAIGLLAGGVAHDFNNMLGVILGHNELALQDMNPADPLYDDLMEIGKAADRSAELTRQLLAFARKQTVDPKVLDLNDTLESTLNMLRRLIGEDINLAWLPGANIAPIRIDPSQVDQMLANLCVNARDAIAGVGHITIETREVTFDEEYCADHAGFMPGSYAQLTVSDDGRGMEAAVLDRLYEPYFTTKALGQGTGLGLATVYGIIKQNSGFINAYSEVGKGTSFKIYLPTVDSELHESETEITSTQEPHGEECILLVEDEPSILQMTTRILESLGYRVLATSSASEAIEILESNRDDIQLLLTDVIMPEMSGQDLIARLRRIRPEIMCLYMSGYTANVIAHHGVLDEGVNFIQKPFSRNDLAHALRRVLQ